MIKARLDKLNKAEVLKYLGFSGQKYSEDMDLLIEKCMEQTIEVCSPKIIYRILEFKDGQCDEIKLEGEDIRRHLSSCSRIVLMAATAGRGISDIARQKAALDMAQAAILNSCGSAAVERICDNFEDDLRAELAAEDLYLTDRFSPGYGDLPLSTQKQLCAVLDTERKIGINLTKSFLMIPEKSVTAIMGISKQAVAFARHDCSKCSMYETCSFRSSGAHCGK